MEKLINKIFEIFSKPAKWIFVIGGFVYAAWFALRTGMSMDGQVMNIITNIIILLVGTALLCIPPVMILIKKEDLAKIFFVFLLGYWVLSMPTVYFSFAEGLADAREFFPIFVSIFLLITGLALVAVLVLVILEVILKAKIFRTIYLGLAILVCALSVVCAILFFIEGIIQGGWLMAVGYGLIEMIVLPFVVGCGCLYLLGVDKKGE